MTHLNRANFLAVVTYFTLIANSFAGGHDPKVLAPLLKQTKVSLLDAIELAEKSSGVVTSAKFEIGDDGKLALSVYTVPEGLGVAPEKATLTELSGDPLVVPYKPAAEVFTDKEHIARASVHLTLAQLSSKSLKQVVQDSVKKVPGMPFDARNPMMRNKRPVVEVLIAAPNGEVKLVSTDLISNKMEVQTVK